VQLSPSKTQLSPPKTQLRSPTTLNRYLEARQSPTDSSPIANATAEQLKIEAKEAARARLGSSTTIKKNQDLSQAEDLEILKEEMRRPEEMIRLELEAVREGVKEGVEREEIRKPGSSGRPGLEVPKEEMSSVPKWNESREVYSLDADEVT